MSVPLTMLVLFVSAKLMAEVAERLRQPGIVGEIIAGILIGPSVLGWLHPSNFLSAMSDLGAMFLLFRVGLEIKAPELLRVGATATIAAVSGVVLPFVAGLGLMLVWGANLNESIFIGASLVATSVGVTAQVLAASGLLNEVSSRVILAAAVIDDVLGLLVLSGVSSIAHGRLDLAQLLLTCFLAASFTFVIAKWGSAAVQRLAPRAQRSMRQSESRFVLSLVLLLALSVLAMRAGIAAIVGAFLAGLALAETAEERDRDLAQGLSELLVPFFLAGIGLQVDLHVFLHPAAGILAGVLLIAAVLSKFVGCGLGSLQLGKANAVRVGIGMIPRGEVGMIVAQIGLTSKILSATYYGIVVFMSVATTVIAPPLIRRVFPRKPRVQEELLRVM